MGNDERSRAASGRPLLAGALAFTVVGALPSCLDELPVRIPEDGLDAGASARATGGDGRTSNGGTGGSGAGGGGVEGIAGEGATSGAGSSAGQSGGGPNSGSGPSEGAAGRDAGNDADSGPPDAEGDAGCRSLIAFDGGCVECSDNWHCADDGNPCTGVEFCASDGSCASTGDPCSGEKLVCLRESGECVQCTDDSSCGDGERCDPTGACVECVADSDCTEPSERYCLQGTCVECSVDEQCGATDCGELSPCTFEGGVCDETGSQAQTCVVPVCVEGACSSTSQVNSQECGRSTEGSLCEGGTTCDGFGACEFASECSETGEQSRTCRDRSCAGGSCSVTARTETRTCTRETDGDTCAGGSSCDGFGACVFESECSETGEQTRTCLDRNCTGGSCSATTRTETRSCTRDTEGNSCEGGSSCDGFSSCAGFSTTCDETGTQSRSCTDRVCSAGRCSATPRLEQQSCGRDTDGNTCEGGTTCGGFGSCGSFSNICDETGIQSRSCTDRACSAGSCSNSKRTERQSCTRDTDGNTCDDSQFCTGSETCRSGVCQSSGNPCPGADGDSDCSESCDEASDSCDANDPRGGACGSDNSCDGNGQCVQCLSDRDCTSPFLPLCVNGRCGRVPDGL